MGIVDIATTWSTGGLNQLAGGVGGSEGMGGLPGFDMFMDTAHDRDAAEAMREAAARYGAERQPEAQRRQLALRNQLGALQPLNNLMEEVQGGGVDFNPAVQNYPTLRMSPQADSATGAGGPSPAPVASGHDAYAGWLREHGGDPSELYAYADAHPGWWPEYDQRRNEAPVTRDGYRPREDAPFMEEGQGPRFETQPTGRPGR